MSDDNVHFAIPALVDQWERRSISRREFLRTATLLGMSAAAAYRIVGLSPAALAAAQALPQGGTVRIAHPIKDVSNPQALNWFQFADLTFPVVQTLTRIGADNVTRPHLAASWGTSPDLRSWTIKLRPNAKWRKGRPFTVDDVIWNIKRLIDPATGSVSLGLMQPYLLNVSETDGKKKVELWDANAVEKVDDHTFKLNLKIPQVTIPEDLFTYTSVMLDPEENGAFGIGANGTGPFEMAEFEVSKRAVYRKWPGYWGTPANLDVVEFIDFGDDPNAAIAALASRQVDGLYQVAQDLLPAVKNMEHVKVYSASTANNATLQLDCTQKPWSDPRVRLAMRLAVDPKKQVELAVRGLGTPGEHHHAAPVHPDYSPLPPLGPDPAKAKQLLADAGYADGITADAYVSSNLPWTVASLEGMADEYRAIGVNLNVKTIPGSQFWEMWGKVPVIYSDWSHRPLAIQMYALVYRTGVDWNTPKWSNAEFDKLLDEASSIIDPVERRKVVAKLEQILQQDGPMVQPIWLDVQTAD